MSFRCEHCKEAQASGVRPVTRVVMTQPNKYGRGTQIVKEMKLCTPCDPVVSDKVQKIQEELAKAEADTGLKASLGSMMR